MKETTAKLNKTKSRFFRKINKIDKPLARLIRRERTRINKIRNEKGEVTMNTAEIQSVIRNYYKQLYANKMDNLEEMDKFLERCKLPRLNKEETENMNRQITSNKIETVICLFIFSVSSLFSLGRNRHRRNTKHPKRLLQATLCQ